MGWDPVPDPAGPASGGPQLHSMMISSGVHVPRWTTGSTPPMAEQSPTPDELSRSPTVLPLAEDAGQGAYTGSGTGAKLTRSSSVELKTQRTVIPFVLAHCPRSSS